MVINLRDDIVLERVSGINILVALRSAWECCPFAIQISPLAAFFWKSLKDGVDVNTIISTAAEEKNIDPVKIMRFYKLFLSDLEKYHYLLPEEKDI